MIADAPPFVTFDDLQLEIITTPVNDLAEEMDRIGLPDVLALYEEASN